MMSKPKILEGLTTTPSAPKYHLYRWCDYVELRCLTHKDKRFSRDNLQEAMIESKGVTTTSPSIEEIEEEEFEEEVIDETVDVDHADSTPESNDADESYASRYFKQLLWRSHLFGDAWPFSIDTHAQEIKLKSTLTQQHYLYLQLLLSASLDYCPKKRSKVFTSNFEKLSVEAMPRLMPPGSEIHAFGAGNGSRYTGHLFDRLIKLTTDLHARLHLSRTDFGVTNAGDGGLDIVAWHDLGDDRDGKPIALAQCGCTGDGWPNKMLEASPARLSKKLITCHDWTTYYFMPLDLAVEQDGRRHWQRWLDIAAAIVIDRFRLIKLSDPAALDTKHILTRTSIDEARSFALT